MSSNARKPVPVQSVVSLSCLTVLYGDVEAVCDVDLEVAAAAVTALVGPSGCGKTSLLRVIAGFEAPASGTVRVGDRVVAGDGMWVPPERRRVGMVFQEGALFPHLTVFRNVEYGLRGNRNSSSRVAEMLDLVGMEEYGERFPDELSGGQQQRVALARALAPAPEIVLLDEPFSGLDPGLRGRVREQVRTILEAADAAAVLVTHDQEEALGIADQVAVMSSGRLLQVGSPDELYREPASADVARIIGEGQLLQCKIQGGEVNSIFPSFPTAHPDGAALLLVRPEDLVILWATGEEVDPLQGPYGTIVRRRFCGHDILEDVQLECGERLGIRLMSSPGLPVGTRVRVRLRHNDLRFFSWPA